MDMQRQDFLKIVSAIKTYYPREKNLLPNPQSIELWYQQLKDIDYRVLELAVNKWASTQKWSPSIADLRETVAEFITQENDSPDSWSNAWERVIKSIGQFGIYRVDEALNYIGEYSQIARDATERLGFKNICLSDNITADRARFSEIYKSLSDRQFKKNTLSLDMKNRIDSIKQLLANNDTSNTELLENKDI